jgi:hypothetical protein
MVNFFGATKKKFSRLKLGSTNWRMQLILELDKVRTTFVMPDVLNFSFWEVSEFVMGTLTTVLLAIMGMIATSDSSKSHHFHKWFRKWGWHCIAVVVIGTIVSHTMAAAHHHNYDPELVLRFEDKFDGMKQQRAQAATAIYEYLQKGNWDSVTNTDDLDNVLGFFDELGFYWKNGEMSATVLHEHFYDVLEIYYQGASGYIAKDQKQESATDFEYVKPLFKTLAKIEAKRARQQTFDYISDTNIYLENLKSEMRLDSDVSKK